MEASIWLTMTQVAELLGVSTGTVKNMERDGRLPRATRFGSQGERRWRFEAIEPFLPKSENEAQGHPQPARSVAATQ